MTVHSEVGENGHQFLLSIGLLVVSEWFYTVIIQPYTYSDNYNQQRNEIACFVGYRITGDKLIQTSRCQDDSAKSQQLIHCFYFYFVAVIAYELYNIQRNCNCYYCEQYSENRRVVADIKKQYQCADNDTVYCRQNIFFHFKKLRLQKY